MGFNICTIQSRSRARAPNPTARARERERTREKSLINGDDNVDDKAADQADDADTAVDVNTVEKVARTRKRRKPNGPSSRPATIADSDPKSDPKSETVPIALDVPPAAREAARKLPRRSHRTYRRSACVSFELPSTDPPSTAADTGNWFDDSFAMMNEGVFSVGLNCGDTNAMATLNVSSGSSSVQDTASQPRLASNRAALRNASTAPSAWQPDVAMGGTPLPVEGNAEASSPTTEVSTPSATVSAPPSATASAPSSAPASVPPSAPASVQYMINQITYDHGFCRDRFQAWRLPLNRPGAVKEWSDAWEAQPGENGMSMPWVRFEENHIVEVPQITVDDIANHKAGRSLVSAPKELRNTAARVGKAQLGKLMKGDLVVGVMPDGVSIELKYAPENRKPSPLIVIAVNGKQRCQVDIMQCKNIEAALTLAHQLFQELADGNLDIMDVYSRRNFLMEELASGNIVVNHFYLAFEHFDDQRVLGPYPKDTARLPLSAALASAPAASTDDAGLNGGAIFVSDDTMPTDEHWACNPSPLRSDEEGEEEEEEEQDDESVESESNELH